MNKEVFELVEKLFTFLKIEDYNKLKTKQKKLKKIIFNLL